MNINLEQIELVKDKTGASYAEAKEALENNNGSVSDAIVELEGKLGKEYENIDISKFKESTIYLKAKEIIEKGNISRIIVKKDDVQYVNIPLTVTVVGAVIVPWIAIAGVVAAFGTKCQMEFVDDKGNVIDINGKVVSVYDQAKELINKGVEKASEYGVTEKVEEIKDKIEELGKNANIDELIKKINLEEIEKKVIEVKDKVVNEIKDLK